MFLQNLLLVNPYCTKRLYNWESTATGGLGAIWKDLHKKRLPEILKRTECTKVSVHFTSLIKPQGVKLWNNPKYL